MSCGTQSTYNRVANAGNLHLLSPFQMPSGILHSLTGKKSLVFPIEKCHFITAIKQELLYVDFTDCVTIRYINLTTGAVTFLGSIGEWEKQSIVANG